MKIKIPVIYAIFLCVSSVCLWGAKNIVLIMVDDMRFDQMSGAGHPFIETPNLDLLAKNSISFSRAYVTSPVCGPSRASLYTARLPSDHHRYNNFLYGSDLEPYLPDAFRGAGYRTAMVGKFYERPHRDKKAMSKRYDRWFVSSGADMSGYTGAADDGPAKREYYLKHMYYDQKYDVDGVEQVIKGHQTDILFAEATRFIEEQSEQPFMLLLHPFAPHSPFNPSERNLNRYKGKGLPLRPNQEFDKGWFGERNELSNFEDVSERTCEMIVDIDEGVGQLIRMLSSSGKLENTILVFTSDNGTQMGEHGFGWKRHPWEESIRVPLIIYDPDAYGTGVTEDALVSIADLFPTLAEAVGVDLPEDPKRYGHSFLNLLRDVDALPQRGNLVVEQFPQEAKSRDMEIGNYDWIALVRDDGFKYFKYLEETSMMRPDWGQEFLYNLEKDPYEQNNLVYNPEHGNVQVEMKAALKPIWNSNDSSNL